jgi:hypothetical protein
VHPYWQVPGRKAAAKKVLPACHVGAKNFALEVVLTSNMKPKTIARALALSIALLPPAFAIQPSTPPLSDAIVALSPSVSRGMSQETVEFMLGKPDEKLSADAWVYWNFKARGVPVSDGIDTLVIGFTGDRVTLIRLSKSGPVRAFITRQKARATEQSRGAQ